MRVNIKGLSNRLDDLRERLNDLFDKLDDLEQEDIEVETVRQYFRNDDTFNLSIALDVLEQADKLDKVLDIIKEKEINVQNFKNTCSTMSYEQYLFMWEEGCFMGIMLTSKTMLTQEEFDLLKEVLL